MARRDDLGVVLRGHNVMIVGAGPGLGRSCAAAALRDRANVTVVARNGERLAALAAELDSSGDSILAVAADLADHATLETAVAAAVERFGSLDAVINVAALDTMHAPFDGITDELLAANLEANVGGAMRLVRAARAALADGGGAVVFVGSQASLKPVDVFPQAAYGAAKAALLSLARDLAAELGPEGIRVNTVVPSWMWGPNVQLYCEWQAAERGTTAQAIRDEIASGMALREMPTDADVAEAAIFLASERARMITGQRLLVNAGDFFDT